MLCTISRHMLHRSFHLFLTLGGYSFKLCGIMKPMKFILPFFFFLSLHAQAQKSLTPQAFQINVRPVLSGILNDFYQMIALFPDFPQELSGIVVQLESMNTDKEHLLTSCPRLVNDSCYSHLRAIQNKLSLIQARTLKLFVHQKISSSLHLNTITGMRLVQDFHATLEEVKGELDNSTLMIKASIRHKKETYQIVKQLDELNTLISLAIVEYIPYTYKEDFRHFFFNFVHPIQQHISKNRNYEFLNRNVNSLNFAVNLLNMNLTKRNKKTPEGMSPYLSLIHNRWNSLLRFYF